MILHEGLISIGKEAFRSTGIREIVIPKSVKIIKENAFRDCEELISVTL